MQFYKNAIEIRKEITNWMLKDFGTTKNKKSDFINLISIENNYKIKDFLLL